MNVLKRIFAGINRKLTIAFVVITLMIVAVGVFVYINTITIVDATEQLGQTVVLMHDAARKVRESMLREMVALEQVHRRDHDIAVTDFQQARTNMASAIQLLREKSLMDTAELDSLSSHEHQFHLLVEKMFAAQAQLMNLNENVDARTASQLSSSHDAMMKALDDESQHLKSLLVKLEWRANQLTSKKQTETSHAISNVMISQFFLLSLGIAITFFIAALVKRKVANPLRKLTEEVILIGKGNLDRRIHTGGSDEIKVLEDTFNQMLFDLRQSIQRHTVLQMELMDEQKHSAIGKLTQGIVHNLRGPLTNVSLACQRLEKNGHPTTEVEIIKKASHSLENIIDSLISKSRQEHENDIRPIDLNLMVVEELDFLDVEESFRYKIRKAFDLAPQLPLVQGRYSDFSQAFLNLVQNARDAMFISVEKILTISTRTDATHICIDVTDTGCGIPPEIFSKLFDPFFTTKPRRGEQQDGEPVGTGLGLWSCRQLLQPYGAMIEVKSKIGSGSTFTMKIPYKLNHREENAK